MSKKPLNPIGLHVHAQALGGAERQKFIDHAIHANYKTMTIMDDFTLAMEMAEALPDSVIVHRAYTFEPAPDKDGVIQLSAYLSGLYKTHGSRAQKVVIMVNCEQGYYPERLAMYAEMLEVAHNANWRLCVGNFSSGTPKAGMGDDPNEWVLAKLLFEAFKKFPEHFLGIHEYTGFFTWQSSNGGTVPGDEAWDKRPTKIDWTKPQWHSGRLFGMAQAARYLGLPVPRVIITEGTLDDMDDIAYKYGDRTAGRVGLKLKNAQKANGPHSLEPQWAEWYPNRDPGEIFASMNIWLWENVYEPLGFVVGIHVFTYEDNTKNAPKEPNKWLNFRVDTYPQYLLAMESYPVAPVVIVPTPAPVPVPPVPTPTPTPAEPRPDWRDALDDRQLALVLLSETYKANFADASAPGHSMFMLTALLAHLLDRGG